MQILTSWTDLKIPISKILIFLFPLPLIFKKRMKIIIVKSNNPIATLRFSALPNKSFTNPPSLDLHLIVTTYFVLLVLVIVQKAMIASLKKQISISTTLTFKNFH